MRSTAWFAGVLVAGIGSTSAHAAPDPLTQNLRTLEKRASTPREPGSAPARPPDGNAARAVPRSVRRIRRVRQEPVTAAAREPGRAGTGELQVSAEGIQPIHVYVRNCLVSGNGDGKAAMKNLPAGKYAVMLWAPLRAKRRNYWVTVRPGTVAALRTRL